MKNRFKTSKTQVKSIKKDVLNTQIRKKLGVTQAQLATICNISRTYINMVENGSRHLNTSSNIILLNFYLQFHELETGKQPDKRSLETTLFLNAEYKKALPRMKSLEDECRYRAIDLKKQLSQMKERARDAEHAIIVLTTAIKNREKTGKPGDKSSQITGLTFLKEQAYNTLLTSWEPEQAKLHARIEAIAGEAKALRRYRTKINREHDPLKEKKYKASM